MSERVRPYRRRPASEVRSNPAILELAEQDTLEKSYLARELVQCTLPHSNPKQPVWIRRNGDYSLIMTTGYSPDGNPVGLPYGTIPRLVLIWLNTRVKETGERRVELGSSLSQFLREVGLDPRTGRGKRGDAKRLKEQIVRLLNASIQFDYSTGDEERGRNARHGMNVARKYDLWWDFKAPTQDNLFGSWIEVSEDFYEAILASTVPLSTAALKKLKRSPLAIDLYAWASYRMHVLGRSGRSSVTLPIGVIHKQFGAEYTRTRDFKGKLESALVKVKEVLPTMNYEIDEQGFTLYRGRPAIQSKPRGNSAREVQTQRILKTREFDPDTMDKARELAKGWDIDVLAQAFWAWIDENEITVRDPQKMFLSFCKSHNAKNR